MAGPQKRNHSHPLTVVARGSSAFSTSGIAAATDPSVLEAKPTAFLVVMVLTGWESGLCHRPIKPAFPSGTTVRMTVIVALEMNSWTACHSLDPSLA